MTDTREDARSRVRSGQAAGVAGLLFSALFVASLALLRNIPVPAAGDDLDVWLSGEAAGTISLVTLYLVPFCGIAFLWFMAVLREHAGKREDRFFDTVFLGSGLLFVAMFFSGAASLASLVTPVAAADAAAIGDEAIGLARSVGFSFTNIYSARVASVFIIVTSSIVLRTGFLPRWFAFLGIGLALVLLFGMGLFQWIIYIFPMWVALMSVALLMRLASLAEVDS